MNPANAESVIVVSGLPRSGTSMMMQMLAAGGIPVLADHLREADADNRRGYFEFEPVKKTKQDSSWLQDARGKAVKLVYALLYDLPDRYSYRVLFMRRDLHEVVKSQQVMLERRGETGAGIALEAMIGVFERELAKVDRWLDERPHFQRLDVNYADVIGQPQVQAERVCQFLGGGWDVSAMGAAVDPALYRQQR